MPRFHNKGLNGGLVAFTAEEETARDAEEATWAEEGPARAMAQLRTKRNAKLVESDWTQYNDSPLTDEAKAEWAVHREELRDLPENTDDPVDPTWPTPPG
jgi:hypothetical protein